MNRDGITDEKAPTTDDREVAQPAQWFLRGTADHDTHRGRLFGDGTVMADCGLVFRPRKALRDRGPALPGEPPDPDQVCGKCKGVGR